MQSDTGASINVTSIIEVMMMTVMMTIVVMMVIIVVNDCNVECEGGWRKKDIEQFLRVVVAS